MASDKAEPKWGGFHGTQSKITKDAVANDETSEQFAGRLSITIRDAAVTNLLALGSHLGLFELMAQQDKPVTSGELAKAGGFRERYVREWLGGLACAQIVDVSEDGMYFSLPAHKQKALAGDHPGNLAHLSAIIPMIAGGLPKVLKCFYTDGPPGSEFSDYEMGNQFMDILMKMRNKDVLRKFFSKAPGLIEKLEAGIQVLEIGGNSGDNAFKIAEIFPKSSILSSDIQDDEVAKGKEQALNSKYKNIDFQVVDATAMPADWSNKFDLVFAFDLFHDIGRADLAMSETFRVLKHGGMLMFNDVNAHSSLKDNCSNPQVAMLYGISTLYCLPLSLSSPDSLGLGTVWGKERAISMLKDAGFKNPKIVDENAVDYLCIKE